jgi:phosphoribosyl 1,2-cyclic phosphodiesterase
LAEPTNNNSFEIRVLASGSSGNSIFIASKQTNILIDAGLTCKELTRRLATIGRTPESVSAIIVTHEHQDHIRGVGVISRRHEIPIYMNAATLEGGRSVIGDAPTIRTFATGDVLSLGDLTVQTYSVPHDAADPVGLTIRNCSKSVGIALDMGYPTWLVRERLRGSNALVLEFNHDPDMLRECARPWEVKQRIMSKIGHMSNEDALEFLSGLIHDELEVVVLAHISKEANCGNLLRTMVAERLEELGRSDIEIILGSQDEVGVPIRI